MAKTRHKSPRTAMRYLKPGDAAVAEVTSLLGPPRRSHCAQTRYFAARRSCRELRAVIWDLAAAINAGSWRAAWSSNLGGGLGSR